MDSVLDMDTTPGEGLVFEDVTSLFANAAQDMDPETMYFMDGFTLMDAMSAFEIGEPRLDTGYVGGEREPPPFNPLAPLLPEEVCWILDRALACEMEWHAGNMLAHTVFTMAYTFHLPDIETGALLPAFLSEVDPRRPVELVTGVLGPCVQGLLKCIDLTWRDMHNNDLIQDTEDWQSDKCEVPVMEGAPAQYVIEKLQRAAKFVAHSPKIDDAWKQPLVSRILFRRAFLELFNTGVSRSPADYQILLNQARECLDYMSSQTPLKIAPESPAQNVFDPYISRRLNTSVPVRVIPLPPEDRIWSMARTMIDSLQEVRSLVACHNPATWEVMGKLRLWLGDAPRPAYTRSLAQTSFYNDLLVLDQFNFSWALDRLFDEATGHTWTDIVATVKNAWKKPSAPQIPQIERRLYKLAINRIKSLWLNPPRRRRYLMKSVVEWHEVYDLCLDLIESVSTEPTVQAHIASKLPQIILSFRLEDIREIVLSGFQLDLYASHERPHAYWFTAKVIQAHVECHDALLPFLSKDSKPYHEMLFQQRVLMALGDLASASFLVTLPMIPLDWEEALPAFIRRYKWAYRPDYQRTKAQPVVQPDLYEFMRAIDDEALPPQEHVQFAKSVVEELLDSNLLGGWAGDWVSERKRSLLSACEQLSGLPDSLEGLTSFDPKARPKWDPVGGHPWFPSVTAAQA